MSHPKLDILIEAFRKLREDAGMTVGGGNIAGMPPEDTDPPVDLKKKKKKVLSTFRRSLPNQ
ncbi:hypothetical protein Syn7803US13_187 [Synechococcus phage ACG-2014f]|uniref:Uncharacterized protein n=5 Tax=Atlauavirus TaxID=2733092 RepID=A0A0E3HLG3_9CAUD|nr:hypothetical protein AAJ63_gp200 [Synechococcus phage ACG-2014f]YP_009778349.1 hypothetical protein HOQ61_gp195 [Synechococcus phage ACG-2014f_Syn7803C7]YP_009778637.1 hypothetical protein HOQ62_gp197 [Synechococcus phage ACG-2014f_Syn7803C8]YP_009778914.1 hypothetical protein HOQ63_gp187 [Synechococcus phage ACG-2014f_Syn7803US26]AIX18495.1 hypothetical protein Syn7803C6_196 [Synechococcus phage ACG-2014f]AIX20086.1 hypothetical protein Syn7803C7_195 [Synechococcus phage ACG-2014f_Syn7803C